MSEAAFQVVRYEGRDYRVYLQSGFEPRGRVAGLQLQCGRLVERDLTVDSQRRRDLLAMARRADSVTRD
jgi:hypothetical protein